MVHYQIRPSDKTMVNTDFQKFNNLSFNRQSLFMCEYNATFTFDIYVVQLKLNKNLFL